MHWLIVYIVIGLVWSCLLVMDDDRRVICHPGYTLFVTAVWPILIWYLIGRIKRITFKGKVLWQRKGRK